MDQRIWLVLLALFLIVHENARGCPRALCVLLNSLPSQFAVINATGPMGTEVVALQVSHCNNYHHHPRHRRRRCRRRRRRRSSPAAEPCKVYPLPVLLSGSKRAGQICLTRGKEFLAPRAPVAIAAVLHSHKSRLPECTPQGQSDTERTQR